MRFSVALFSLLIAPPLAAQTAQTMHLSQETKGNVQRVLADTLINGQAYEYDRQLADGIGPRLTGSPNYLKSVQWGLDTFKKLGLTDVHTETFRTDTWEPEVAATGELTAPVRHTPHITSYGWSPSTPKGGVSGQVVYVTSFTPAGLKALGDVSKKILAVDPDSYGKNSGLADYTAAVAAAQAMHPAGMILTGKRNGVENASALTVDGTLSTFPVAQIGTEDELLLRRLLKSGPVNIAFRFTNHTAKNVEVPQVVAEIRGSEKPDEVVIVGGHLDSWHPGTGAQDNGTGIAQVLDAARAIQSLGHPPKRTVRFILFGGEEQALLGSVAYAKAHTADMNRIDAVLITDTGSGAPKGWLMMGRFDERATLSEFSPMLAGLGAAGLSEDPRFMFGSDQAPFLVQGVPTMLLWNDITQYETLHHRPGDTFDSVDKATLLQDAAVVAATAYAIADADSAFGEHTSPAQVETMLRATKQWDDYVSMRDAGLLK